MFIRKFFTGSILTAALGGALFLGLESLPQPAAARPGCFGRVERCEGQAGSRYSAARPVQPPGAPRSRSAGARAAILRRQVLLGRRLCTGGSAVRNNLEKEKAGSLKGRRLFPVQNRSKAQFGVGLISVENTA